MTMNADQQKQEAARAALEMIEPGMRLGLGTGSTAAHLVRFLGERVRAGLDVLCVPTSERTQALAKEAGVPLTTLNETPQLDLTIDGADEIDPKLRLIKGGGGALLREKIVAMASRRMVVIADESKLVETLGRFALPVEVIPFGSRSTELKIHEVADRFGCRGEIRQRCDEYGEPFVTDSNNFIFDCAFGRIPDPDGLATHLNALPGVVDNGLFIGIAEAAIIAGPAGVRIVRSR